MAYMLLLTRTLSCAFVVASLLQLQVVSSFPSAVLEDVYGDDVSPTADGPIVTTKYGQVLGNRKLFNRKWYEEFLGIPFAAPPVGQFRWKRPGPAQPWEGVLNATEYQQHCTQFIAMLYPLVGMSGGSGEDCLYLNIWVPQGVDANQGRQLPVMVWFYGGGFTFGTGEMYPGYALAQHGEVIVVNINYRVSSIGWLSTGDSSSPGNYGLWDVEAALVWIQENIAAFAGDPSRVTLFGQSAGGALVSHAVISPKLRGLFSGGIAMSGSSTGMWGLETSPLRSAVLLAEVMRCSPMESTADLVNCLYEKDAHALDFWGTVSHMAVDRRLPGFIPVVDGEIMPMLPADCFKQGYGRFVNFISGSGYHDAAGFVLLNPIALPAIGDKLNVADTEEEMISTMHMMMNGALDQDELLDMIMDQYPQLSTTDNHTRTLAATEAFTDWFFAAPSNWELAQHVATSDDNVATYKYQFNHRQSFLVGYPSWVNGSHMDDIYSILGDPFMKAYRRLFLKADFDVTDNRVSVNMMNYYTNFAHTGNPNEGPFEVPVEWEQFDPSRQNFLHEAPIYSMQTADSRTVENYEFWYEFIKHVHYPPDPTFPLPLNNDDGFQSNDNSFHNIRKRYRLTEEDIQKGVERFRHMMRQYLVDHEDKLLEVEAKIDEMVADRAKQLNIQHARQHL